MDESTPAAPAEPSSPLDVVRSALPGILSRSKIVLSPYPFGMSDDDNLRVTAVNSVAGVVVNVHTRRILKDLTPTADTPSFTPASDRTATSVDVPLAGGYVTNLSVFASGATPKKGQCFVIVQMIRGLGVSATVLGTLLAGYITATQPIGWPGSPIESSTDGEPVVRVITGTQPAVDTEILETVPTGARWEMLSVRATLQRGGVGAGEAPILTFDDGATRHNASVNPLSLGAGNFGELIWTQGVQSQTPSSLSLGVGPLPSPNRLLAGHRIRTLNSFTNTGNQWSAPLMVLREWQEAA